jgi:hypothetical protein
MKTTTMIPLAEDAVHGRNGDGERRASSLDLYALILRASSAAGRTTATKHPITSLHSTHALPVATTSDYHAGYGAVVVIGFHRPVADRGHGGTGGGGAQWDSHRVCRVWINDASAAVAKNQRTSLVEPASAAHGPDQN